MGAACQSACIQPIGKGILRCGFHQLAVNIPAAAQLVCRIAICCQLHGALPIGLGSRQLGVIGAAAAVIIQIHGTVGNGFPVSRRDHAVVVEGVIGLFPAHAVIGGNNRLNLGIHHGQVCVCLAHALGSLVGNILTVEFVGRTALGGNDGLFVQRSQIHRLLHVQQCVAVNARTAEFIFYVGEKVILIVVQGAAHPIHVCITGIERIHIH